MTMLLMADKKTNTKAFTLVELMLATILGMLVMIGSVGVIENMQRESQNFQSRITDNMTWVEANQHIAHMVRSSSYLKMPDANTLELYNYDDSLKGTYTNDTVNHRIDYTVGDARQARFQNVNATFADPATPANPQKGRASNGKQIETIVNYTVNYEAPSTMPFTSAISLGCRVAVAGEAPSSLWHAIIYDPYQRGANSRFQYPTVIRTFSGGVTPDGFVVIWVNIDVPKVSCHMGFVKFDLNGNAVIKKMYCNKMSISGIDNISQCIDGGYVIALHGQKSGSNAILVLKLDFKGDVDWTRLYANQSASQGAGPEAICQTLDQGYLVNARLYEGGKDNALLLKLDDKGDRKWSVRIMRAGWTMIAGGVTEELSARIGGFSNGYLVSGSLLSGSSSFGNYIIRVTGSPPGLLVNKQLYSVPAGQWPSCGPIKQVFNLDGTPAGFITGGNSIPAHPPPMYTCFYLLKAGAGLTKLNEWTFGDGKWYGWGVETALDGNYLMSGGYNYKSILLAKISQSGGVLKSGILGSDRMVDAANAAREVIYNGLSDGYIVSGKATFTEIDPNYGIYVVRTNANMDSPSSLPTVINFAPSGGDVYNLDNYIQPAKPGDDLSVFDATVNI